MGRRIRRFVTENIPAASVGVSFASVGPIQAALPPDTLAMLLTEAGPYGLAFVLMYHKLTSLERRVTDLSESHTAVKSRVLPDRKP